MFDWTAGLLFVSFAGGFYLLRDRAGRWIRRRWNTRGREVERSGGDKIEPGQRRWGPFGVTPDDCREHFSAAGKSKSGKTYIQRRLMADVLTSIKPGSDRRCFIFDASSSRLRTVAREP